MSRIQATMKDVNKSFDLLLYQDEIQSIPKLNSLSINDVVWHELSSFTDQVREEFELEMKRYIIALQFKEEEIKFV